MRFTISAASFLALACSVVAQDPTAGFDVLTAPVKDEVLKAGSTFQVVWEPAPSKYDTETVSLLLMFGPSHDKLDVDTKSPIASKIVNTEGGYEWAIPSSLGKDKAYGIKLVLDSDNTVFQYSNPFTIEASEDGNSTSSSSSAEPSATESSSGNFSATGKPKTTLTQTVPGGNGPTNVPTTTSPGAGAQATAGSLALLGGLAIAALAL